MARIDKLEKLERKGIKVEYQVTVTRHGQLLVITAWSNNLPAVCDFTDTINHSPDTRRAGYRATVQTRAAQ